MNITSKLNLTKSRIILNMIVKNEEAIIGECIEMLYSFGLVHAVAIYDTGSEDNTVKVIYDTCERLKIPAVVTEGTWVNFADARQKAIDVANIAFSRSEYTHLFFFDADDTIEFNKRETELSGEETTRINEDIIDNFDRIRIEINSNGVSYSRPLIVSRLYDYKWRCAVHEFLECVIGEGDTPPKTAILSNVVVNSNRTGARSRDDQRYKKDALMLEEYLNSGDAVGLEPRVHFYIAQSYKDYGDIESALKWYKKRVHMEDGWYQEEYISYLNIGYIHKQEGRLEKAKRAFMNAVYIDSSRAEAFIELGYIAIDEKQYHTALWHGINAYQKYDSNPWYGDDKLFVMNGSNIWRAPDIMSIAHYYIGNRRISREYGNIALGHAVGVNASYMTIERLKRNLKFTDNPPSDSDKSDTKERTTDSGKVD